jgi:GT2 family glycosyltransferase
MGKIGVGIITCDRVDMFNICFESLNDEWYDELVVVDDGEEEYPLMRRGAEFIRTTGKVGVGKAKNAAIQNLLDKDCDYIILVEDDMIFKGNLFAEYIKAYKETGIHHFMFGYHGPANKAGISGGAPVPRKVIDYGNDIKIALNQHCVGAVTFYTRESLEDAGLYDEQYTNAFEHVDHSYTLAKKGYSTPYWWWADIANSLDFVQEQKCSEESSAIRPRSDWKSNIKKASVYFIEKNGKHPVDVPNRSYKHVEDFLKTKKAKPAISFIVHYRKDTEERLSNLHIVYNYYKDIYPNCEFIFVEDDSEKTIEHLVKEGDTYVFFDNDGVYRKCEAYNIGFKASTKDIVCFLDIDCLVSINSLITSIKAIKSVENALVIGYNGVAIYLEYNIKNAIQHLKGVNLFNSLTLNVDKTNITTLYNNNFYTIGNTEAVGGCVIASRKTVEKVNGFNPNFIGWGYEDNEIISRCRTLGCKVITVGAGDLNLDNVLFHLPHEDTYKVALNDKSQHEFYKKNHEEVSKVEKMNQEELKNYIKSW